MSIQRIVGILFAAISLLVAGCATNERDAGRIVVAVSIPPQAEFVESIGGERVRVLIMVPPGANPHTYEPSPSQLVELGEASLYVKVGSPIEFELAWLDRILSMNREMLVVDSSEGIELAGAAEPTGETAQAPAGDAERHGESHALDSHIWVSPRNAMIMVTNTCRGLITVDPAHRDEYIANRDVYLGELERLDREITRSLEGKEKRTFLAYHPAWGYLARDYGLEQLSIEAEGKDLTARGIMRTIDEAKRLGIRAVFVSPQSDPRNARLIAREIGGRVVAADPLARNYIQTMRSVARALEEAIH